MKQIYHVGDKWDFLNVQAGAGVWFNVGEGEACSDAPRMGREEVTKLRDALTTWLEGK